MGLSESTRSSRHFKYSLELYLAYDTERMLPEAFAMQLSRDAMIPSISEIP